MKPTALSLALAGELYLGRSYSEMDCQAFVERCLKDIGISMDLAGSNAWYRKMTWTGTPEECVKRFGSVPAGAFLFILDQDGKEPAKYRGDGIGNASHIGIKTGRTQEQMLQAGLKRIAAKYPDRKTERAAAQRAFRKKVGFGSGAIHSSKTRGCVAASRFANRTISGGWNRVGLWDRLDYGVKINEKLMRNGGDRMDY